MTKVGQIRSKMTVKVAEVSAAAAALKAKVDAVETGGEALKPGWYHPELRDSASVSVGEARRGVNGKREGDKWKDVAVNVTPPTWFEGLAALSDTDRRLIQTTFGGLQRRFASVMTEFHEMRHRIREDYETSLGQRHFALTGAVADPETLGSMADAGAGEAMLTRAVRDAKGSGRKDSTGAEERGAAQVQLTLEDVRRRRDAVLEVEEGMLQLHQVFLDMATLVEQQGEMLDNIEVHVARSTEYTQAGARALVSARDLQRKQRRKMLILAAVVFGVIVAVALVALAGFAP